MSDNLYRELTGAVEDLKCQDCYGSGTQDDMGIGDTFFNEWTCKTCQGTGLQGDLQKLKDLTQQVEEKTQ